MKKRAVKKSVVQTRSVVANLKKVIKDDLRLVRKKVKKLERFVEEEIHSASDSAKQNVQAFEMKVGKKLIKLSLNMKEKADSMMQKSNKTKSTKTKLK